MEFFDSHAHYNDEKFDEDREVLLDTIYKDGITKITCNGYNMEKSKLAIKLAQKYDFLYATAGISPNDIEDFSDENLAKIEEMAKEKKVVAIGEIGLDYYWNKENKEEQKNLFIKQIEIANKLDLPITIHSRDASVDLIQILRLSPVNRRGIFHCCQLNQELIKNGLELGYYISFSGNITFKNAKSAGAVSLVPLDRILIETDSPYLAPEPHRGTRNDSRNVKLVAEKIAEIKGVSIEEVAKATYDNACKIYVLPHN